MFNLGAYNPPTKMPVGYQTDAVASLRGLGTTRLAPVPECVNCVAGVAGTSSGFSTGVLVLGALAAIAAGYAIYTMGK